MAEPQSHDPGSIFGVKIAYWEPSLTGAPLDEYEGAEVVSLLADDPSEEETPKKPRRWLRRHSHAAPEQEQVAGAELELKDSEPTALTNEDAVANVEPDDPTELVDHSDYEPEVEVEDSPDSEFGVDGDVDSISNIENVALAAVGEAEPAETVLELEQAVQAALQTLDGSIESETSLLADVDKNELHELGGFAHPDVAEADVAVDTDEMENDLQAVPAIPELDLFQQIEAQARQSGHISTRVTLNGQVWRYVPRSGTWLRRDTSGWVADTPPTHR